ncbi:hypothetical protein K505DRAFT_377945 [Melanomma pulvis-pyrius CBS 109.77]|uniref:Uncharacterized protein n=1 Tax=Melanomma pulvis-pyrius CBS 109.77 TaxID=1314802 RepID=A0A6A6X0X4_9PLEO|nr:hypothetical protein K505DRAFT_377945 [Melanomma pulvis-pyrius CBS 109.77]
MISCYDLKYHVEACRSVYKLLYPTDKYYGPESIPNSKVQLLQASFTSNYMPSTFLVAAQSTNGASTIHLGHPRIKQLLRKLAQKGLGGRWAVTWQGTRFAYIHASEYGDWVDQHEKYTTPSAYRDIYNDMSPWDRCAVLLKENSADFERWHRQISAGDAQIVFDGEPLRVHLVARLVRDEICVPGESKVLDLSSGEVWRKLEDLAARGPGEEIEMEGVRVGFVMGGKGRGRWSILEREGIKRKIEAVGWILKWGIRRLGWLFKWLIYSGGRHR